MGQSEQTNGVRQEAGQGAGGRGDVFAPFRGLLYARDLQTCSAPPYDVLDDDDVAALRALDAHNVVRLDLPTVVGDASAAVGSDATGTVLAGDDATRLAHVQAASLLADWVDEGVLSPDTAAGLYLYRQRWSTGAGERSTVGVVGALAIDSSDVLPHEQTTPKAKSDRYESLDATRTNLSMIYGLSLDRTLPDLLRVPDRSPDLSCTDEQGVVHECWALHDHDEVAALTAAVSSAPVVIADGHHRYEVARRFAHDHASDAVAGAGRIMTFVVPLDERFLVVRPIHRILPSVTTPASELADRLAEVADVDVRPVTDVDPEAMPDRIGFVTGTDVIWCTPTTAAPDDVPATLRDLPVTWLHSVALPAIGATDAVFHHDAATVLRRVADDDAAAGVLLPPVDVATIAAVAAEAERMPPKTTFFWPKARTGLVLRRFADQTDDRP